MEVEVVCSTLLRRLSSIDGTPLESLLVKVKSSSFAPILPSLEPRWIIVETISPSPGVLQF
jgi:hypothetical protein